MSDINELAQQAAAGDKKAFDGLYEQTKNGVWFTCISLLKNEENAKDIMQETYLTAFEKLPALPNFDNVQGWLNKVAANKCKDHLRSSAGEHQAEESGELIEDIPDDALFPEEYVMDKARRAIITDIIENKLSEAQSRTIILYYFDEMTAAEIAELMGCHEKTVLYRLKTARLKIKEEVLRYENESGDRLHAIAPIPLLTLLLRAVAGDTAVPQISFSESAPSVSQDVPVNSAANAAKSGGKRMLNTLKAKIIAGACAAVVAGGGVTAAVIISNNSKKPETSITSSPNVSAPVNVSKPGVQSAPTISEANSTGNSNVSGGTTSGANAVEGDFEYEPMKLNGKVYDDAVMITKYVGSGGDVKIPSTLGGKPVKSIKEAFHRCKNITGVTIPEGVLYIDRRSFQECENLTRVDLPSTIKEIRAYAFEDCESLVEVVIPDSVEKIEYNVFASCDNLKKVVIPDNIRFVSDETFRFTFSEYEVHYKGKIYTKDTIEELYAFFDN